MKGVASMMIFRWLFALTLLIFALMYANSTISYLWASGVSKNADHNYYLSLSNLHFVMTLIFIISFIMLIIFNIRTMVTRKKSVRKRAEVKMECNKSKK